MPNVNSEKRLIKQLNFVLKFLPYHPPWGNPFESEFLQKNQIVWAEFPSWEENPPTPLTGWAASPPNPVGTVILIHGFRENCYSKWIITPAERMIRNLNVAVVAPDLRGHGQSGKRPPTFGVCESFDVSGAISWAQENGYPGPYLLHGGSLGAMAASICAVRDDRVRGAALKSVPASAYTAILNNVKIPKIAKSLGNKLNKVYGFDVIKYGDILNYNPSPKHNPAIFYMVGEHEEYGYDETRLRFNHLYPDENAELEKVPSQAPQQRKWFRTAWGGKHAFGLNEYPEMYDDVDDFFRMLLKDSPGN